MIAAGLNYKMAIGACVLGNTLMGLVITMNGRIGATVSVHPPILCHFADSSKLHTPFPILSRMPFGYYFSYFVVVSRCALAIIWLG